MGWTTEMPEAAANKGEQGRELKIPCAKRKVIKVLLSSPLGQSM